MKIGPPSDCWLKNTVGICLNLSHWSAQRAPCVFLPTIPFIPPAITCGRMGNDSPGDLDWVERITIGNGFRHYTDKGQQAVFSKFIGALSAKEREVFRFPPADHAYYSKQTLALLEKQYPGWNARDEYKASE